MKSTYLIAESIKTHPLVHSDDFVIILDLFTMRWYHLQVPNTLKEDVLKTKKNSGVKPLGSRQSDQPGHGMLILRPYLGVDK